MRAEQVFVMQVKAGIFKVSKDGVIWRMRGGKGYNKQRKFKPLEKPVPTEKQLPSGYKQIRMLVDGKRYHLYSHRAIWSYFCGDIPSGLVINHINGNKSDNRLDNLEVVTHKENHQHAADVLGVSCGERNGMAKLKANDVARIRLLKRKGWCSQDIAHLYSVSIGQVNDIIAGRMWKHIPM